MLVEQLSFHNSLAVELRARLWLPDQIVAPLPLVIFAPGFSSSRDSSAINVVAEQLPTENIGALLLDFTGLGESGGNSAEASLTQQVEDLTLAIAQMRADGRFGAIGLYGELTGGTVALRVTAADSGVRALVLQGPRADNDPSIATRVRVPTLIIQGSADLVVRAESRAIYDSLAGKKYLHIIAGAGHMIDETESYLQEAAIVASQWFSIHLGRQRSAGA